jgi:hypothetical protein
MNFQHLKKDLARKTFLLLLKPLFVHLSTYKTATIPLQ